MARNATTLWIGVAAAMVFLLSGVVVADNVPTTRPAKPITTRPAATQPAVIQSATTTATTQPVASQPTSQPASQPTSRPAVLSAEGVARLIADLGGDDWESAERAAMELANYDRQAEEAIADALRVGDVSEAFHKRAAGVLERIYDARAKIAGTWEEQLWANIKHKQLVKIAAAANGALTIAPAPGARYRQYVYSEVSFDGTTLKFHVQTNPGYEFDVVMKLTDNGEFAGTRTRVSTGETWDFRMTRLRDF